MTSINCNGQTVFFNYAMALKDSKLQRFLSEDGSQTRENWNQVIQHWSTCLFMLNCVSQGEDNLTPKISSSRHWQATRTSFNSSSCISINTTVCPFWSMFTQESEKYCWRYILHENGRKSLPWIASNFLLRTFWYKVIKLRTIKEVLAHKVATPWNYMLMLYTSSSLICILV